MAKFVLGIGTNHGSPSTGNPVGWRRIAQQDQQRELWFRGKHYTYEELREERAGEHLEREVDETRQWARSEACQRAIAVLAKTLIELRPDRCIIVGDDQHELFLDDVMPSVCVFNGETVDDVPPGDGAGPGDDPVRRALVNPPRERISHPTDAAFGTHIIESLVSDGFDVARSRALPAGRHQDHAIGHAFNFVYRRLLDNKPMPSLPIFLNTYFPPNAPTMKRCYQLGTALRRAVESWDSDQRVAIIGSGGLSHFVVEEDLDRHILEGLKEGDERKLTALPDQRFLSGTSEVRNWVVMAGALAGSDLEMELLAYEPCYRTPAGTGAGAAYARWV